MNNRSVKRKERLHKTQPRSIMSSKTQEFLQKICYKKTASVDMTQYGFIRDSHLTLMPIKMETENIDVPTHNQITARNNSLRKKPKNSKDGVKGQNPHLKNKKSTKLLDSRAPVEGHGLNKK